MSDLCYLCGKPGSQPLSLKDSFTAHSIAKCPDSKHLCDRCHWVIPLRCWYLNPNKNAWGKLFSRNWSWLFQGEKVISPIIAGDRGEGKDKLPIVSSLPTRAEIRGWLLNPPEPPFTIVVAESGQKHLVPFAPEAHSRDYFPILFEMDTLYISSGFRGILEQFEELMRLGFGKTEILTGEYRSETLKNCLEEWDKIESIISQQRGSRLFELVAHVAQKPEPKESVQAISLEHKIVNQLTLL
jgi:hypothetical protein